MAPSRKTLQTVLLVLIVFFACAILAVCIATVVKVYKKDNNDNTATTAATATATGTTTVTAGPEMTTYTPAVIDQNNTQYTAFGNATARLKSLMNLNADPCDDFYEFVCGNYAGDVSFDVRQNLDYEIMSLKYDDQTYQNSSLPKPVKEMLKYYQKCLQTNFTENQNNVEYVRNIIKSFANRTGLGFPLANGSNPTSITPTQLGKAIGYLYGSLNIPTFLTPWVDTHWKVPMRGYLLMFDQSTLQYGNNFYNKAWDLTKDDYRKAARHVIKALYPNVDAKALDAKITDIFKMEIEIAKNYSTDDVMKRLYNRQFNMYTTTLAQSQFSFIDWPAMLVEIGQYADQDVKNKLNGTGFQFVLNEPDQLRKLGQAIVKGQKPFTAETIINYFSVRILLSYQEFLQLSPESSETVKWRTSIRFPQFGRRKDFWSRPPQLKEITKQKYTCIDLTMNNLQYSNARVFLDAYPEDRNATRVKVAQLTDSILVAFSGMLDQLIWMDPLTKAGAYDKITYLVKNMAYPDFITDDDLLTKYYDTMDPFVDTDNIVQMDDKIFRWSMWKQLSRLNRTEYQRDHFDLPPGLVNAWYLPELNSLTLPLATLGQPFFDLNWPVSLNYGSLGVIAGHELTHGFDDEGVQWDGVGALNQWMQQESYSAFNTMAQCVIDEYSNFSFPYNPEWPNINGVQTQGENIADNGGIHAAYRAYKNIANLKGEEPRLDDPFLSQFTHDQLFFMGFAQVWCEKNSTKYGSLTHDLVNPHSPSIFRVLGTVQNFPAFKNAFNCPANKKYTPTKHCDVWVSEVNSDYGFPKVPEQKKVLNVPNPVKILANNSDYGGYTGAVRLLQDSMDFTQDPCNNFYEYACGNYKQERSFTVLREANYRAMAKQMEDPMYNDPATANPLTQTISFYNKCKTARQNFQQSIVNGNTIISVMDGFKSDSGLNFTLLTGENNTAIDAKALGKALGLLSRLGVHTLVTPMVDTKWDPADVYAFYLDQNTLYYDKSYYTDQAWKTISAGYYRDTVDLFTRYANLTKKSLVPADLNATITDIFKLEVDLATTYSTSDTDRRKYRRSFNKFTELPADITFINKAEYFNALAKDWEDVQKYFANAEFYIMEPAKIAALSANFRRYSPNLIANYLFYRLLAGFSEFLPDFKGTQLAPRHEDLGLPHRSEGFHRFGPMPIIYDDAAEECAYETLTLMNYANARFFIDLRYPKNDDRQTIRGKIDELVTSILQSFGGMLDRLPWMNGTTLDSAHDKIKNLVRNYVYPDFIMDDTLLTNYYQEMDLDAVNDNYFKMRRKLITFNNRIMYKQLLNNTKVDRHDFLLQPGTVNAWYQPELNSITFPAGILVQPFYDMDWPVSMNYGGLGVVIGHELSHGFDDEGVQWDGNGSLPEKGWMDEYAVKNFDIMANCVISEYTGFAPLNNTGYKPDHINGENTQGENIADNGGIHAAWNSYKDYIALHGPDPQMPDDTIAQITHDQLFFLSFAQVWCQRPPDNEPLYTQIMTDPHSPSKYRVLGTIQNFPAFRTAYNCPRGSQYAPDKYCSVWVPEVTQEQ